VALWLDEEGKWPKTGGEPQSVYPCTTLISL
jgi:hypothetical protein